MRFRAWYLFAISWTAVLTFRTGAGAESAAPTAFTGDARMVVKRTLKLQDQPIRDFLADLNLATGIRFFAHPSVADDRVTLLAHDRPLADALTAVGSFFGFQWKREGKGPDFGYTLFQPSSAIAREQRDREARLIATAELIADEVALYDRLEGLPMERIVERSDTAMRDLASATDPEKRRALQLEVIVCEQLKASNDWRRLVNRFFRTLNQQQILSILRGGREEYTWPGNFGSKSLPTDVVEELKAAGAAGGSSSIPYLGQITFARLRVSGESSDDPAISWHFQISKGRTGRDVGSEFSSTLPSHSALPDGPAAYLHEPAGWPNDPALARLVTFQIISQPGPLSERPTLGQALMELSRRVRVDVIADAFHTTRIAGIKADNKPLGEALSSLARMTGHRWWKQDDFVMLRSLTFESDRRREPPATAVSRWVQRSRANALELDDYAEISGLTDSQIATLSRMQVRGEFPDSLQPITQVRDHLRFWNSLAQSQRRKARSEGITYESLSAEQKKLYSSAIRDPRASAFSRSRSINVGATADTIARSRLRLIVRETRIWAVKVGDQARLGGNGPKEEALQSLQRENPNTRLEDIRSLVLTTLTFAYETDRGIPISQAWATLPQRWED